MLSCSFTTRPGHWFMPVPPITATRLMRAPSLELLLRAHCRRNRRPDELHSLDGVDGRQLAPVFLVIHAAAEDVAVGQAQAGELGVGLGGAAVVLLVGEHRHLEA